MSTPVLHAVAGFDGDSNLIQIGGKLYPATGSVGKTGIKWEAKVTTGGVTAQTCKYTLPFTVPTGWRVETFVLSSSGFTLASTCGVTDRTVSFRAIQINNENINTALTFVGWRLVKM